MDTERIRGFLASIEAEDHSAPLSEAKALRLDVAEERVVVEEDGEIVAVGVAAPHPQRHGDIHWAVETAVARSMRFPTFELAVVEATLEVVPRGSNLSVWSNRTTLDEALERAGFGRVRRLLYLTIDGPIEAANVSRSLRADEFGALIAANADAFQGHREAASLDDEELGTLATQPWFDLEGIRVVDGEEGLAGFCWTKVHPDGDGEVYRIGVTTAHRGTGLGRALLKDGFAHLLARDDVERGSLWVDEENDVALNLYRGIGMSVARFTTEFEAQR